MKTSDLAADPTKSRLLEAAGEEFAAKGFDGATIRSISDRAKANIAAVNYHFGDKEHLYEAAVLEAHRCGMADSSAAIDDDLEPVETIRAFVRNFLTDVLAKDRSGSWQRALMLREMIQPSTACDSIVRETIRPKFDRLTHAMRAIVPDADDRRLHALVFSVVGQCLHYKFAWPVSVRLIGEEAYAKLDLDFLTDHITTFTLAALGLTSPATKGGVR